MASLFWLILGLVIFLGGHVVTRLGDLRSLLIARHGAGLYRGIYSLVAVMGLAMIGHGFSVYRAGGYIPVWETPRWMPHLVILIGWIAFVLLAATYLPGKIKEKAKHPMLAAVKIWAFAHLLANGDLGSILLFGSFLTWAAWMRIVLKKQKVAEIIPGAEAVIPAARNDLLAVLIGTAATVAFIFGLHKWLIGVAIL